MLFHSVRIFILMPGCYAGINRKVLAMISLYSHTQAFKNPERKQTSLSNHIRELNTKKIKHTIKWEQVDQNFLREKEIVDPIASAA